MVTSRPQTFQERGFFCHACRRPTGVSEKQNCRSGVNEKFGLTCYRSFCSDSSLELLRFPEVFGNYYVLPAPCKPKKQLSKVKRKQVFVLHKKTINHKLAKNISKPKTIKMAQGATNHYGPKSHWKQQVQTSKMAQRATGNNKSNKQDGPGSHWKQLSENKQDGPGSHHPNWPNTATNDKT